MSRRSRHPSALKRKFGFATVAAMTTMTRAMRIPNSRALPTAAKRFVTLDFSMAGRGAHEWCSRRVGRGEHHILGCRILAFDLGRDAALAHDEHAVGHAEHLGQLRGDHEDAHALAREFREQAVHLRLRADVDAARRLVDDEHGGLGGEPLAEHHLLLVAARERAGDGAERARLDLEPARPDPGGAVLEARRDDPGLREVRSNGEGEVLRDARVEHEALFAAVLGHEGEPLAHRGARVLGRHRPSGEPYRSGVVAVDAEDRASDFAPAGAHEPCETDDLAGPHREADVVEDAGTREPLDLEQGRADLGRLLGEEVGDLAADHLRDDLVDTRVDDPVRGDVGAVAHHGDGVAEVEHLVEPVRDEDERAAFVAEAAGDLEEPVDLDAGERRGRLVHDEHLRVERDRLRDLDDLLVGDREALGWAIGVDAHAEPEEHGLDLSAHGLSVDAAESADGLAAHEDVLRDGKVGEEGRLLVDDGDARRLRLGGRREVDVGALEAEDAAVASVEACDDLHERRLARAVLADEGVDGAGSDLDRAGAQRHDGAERLLDAVEQERRRANAGFGGGRHRSPRVSLR